MHHSEGTFDNEEAEKERAELPNGTISWRPSTKIQGLLDCKIQSKDRKFVVLFSLWKHVLLDSLAHSERMLSLPVRLVVNGK